MDLRKCLLTKNECYIAGGKITPGGVMWHSTGANNPNLKRYIPNYDGKVGENAYGNHWDQYRPGGKQICVHAFIGKDASGKIATYQTLPFTMKGWHAGGSANNKYIGFEICEDGLNDKSYFDKVYKEAVEFTAYLCKTYELDPMGKNVIIDHVTGSELGIASDHGDVRHWFSRYGKTLKNIREDVKKAMGGTVVTPETTKSLYRVRKSWSDSNSQIGAYSRLGNAKKACKSGYYVFDESGKVVYPETSSNSTASYKVKVTVDSLNIRSGAGTDYNIVGCIDDKGVYTITEISGDWGKLKSGAGWINLKYTNRI